MTNIVPSPAGTAPPVREAGDRALIQDQTGGPWTAEPWVDDRHPFFFDHPLDHVPGILLVVGLLDLARGEIGAGIDTPGWRVRLALTFPTFCELGQGLTLRGSVAAGPGTGGGAWQLRAEQHGRAVCEGTLALTAGPVTGATVPAVGTTPALAPADLVHRADRANIMVGPLGPGTSRRSSAALEASVLTSVNFPHPDAVRTVDEVIEAARQLCIMLGHVAYERPADGQILWLDVEADVPAGLPRSLPLALRWHRPVDERVRPRTRFALELVVPGDHDPIGTVTCVSHTMSRRAYEKSRLAASAP